MEAQLSKFISDKFKFWSFISMVLLLFVHGYNLHLRYLRPWSVVDEPLTITGYVEYFLANGILRFRIPMLFIISGYLYAMRDLTATNGVKLQKRLKTLLVPYLIWSALAIGGTYVLEIFPYTRGLVLDTNLTYINHKPLLVHDYSVLHYLVKWLADPVGYQLWFIRVLLVYCAAYPALRWCVTNRIARYIYWPVCILLWIGTLDTVLVEGEGLLFFSLGILLQKSKSNIEQPTKWQNPLAWSIVFVSLTAIKTWLAFKGHAIMGDGISVVLTLLHKLVVLSGLIACWFGLDALVKWCMGRQWFVWLSAFSFFIYVFHAPWIAYAIDWALSLFSSTGVSRLVVFVLLPMLLLALSIALGALLRKLTPAGYRLLTGNRGI